MRFIKISIELIILNKKKIIKEDMCLYMISHMSIYPFFIFILICISNIVSYEIFCVDSRYDKINSNRTKKCANCIYRRSILNTNSTCMTCKYEDAISKSSTPALRFKKTRKTTTPYIKNITRTENTLCDSLIPDTFCFH